MPMGGGGMGGLFAGGMPRLRKPSPGIFIVFPAFLVFCIFKFNIHL